MGKQVIAALVSVFLTFTLWLVPSAGMMTAIVIGGQGDPKLAAGALSFPILFAGGACVLSFLALFYLKIHYATMALTGVSALALVPSMFDSTTIGAASAGTAVSLLLAGAVIFGLFAMLRWVYNEPAVDARVVEEF